MAQETFLPGQTVTFDIHPKRVDVRPDGTIQVGCVTLPLLDVLKASDTVTYDSREQRLSATGVKATVTDTVAGTGVRQVDGGIANRTLRLKGSNVDLMPYQILEYGKDQKWSEPPAPPAPPAPEWQDGDRVQRAGIDARIRYRHDGKWYVSGATPGRYTTLSDRAINDHVAVGTYVVLTRNGKRENTDRPDFTVAA